MANAIKLTTDLVFRGPILTFMPSFLRSCVCSSSRFLSYRAYHTHPVPFTASPIDSMGPWTIGQIYYAQKSSKGCHCQRKTALYEHLSPLGIPRRLTCDAETQAGMITWLLDQSANPMGAFHLIDLAATATTSMVRSVHHIQCSVSNGST